MEQPVQIANASGAVGKLDTPRTSNLKFLRDKRLSYFCGKNVKSSLSETDKPQPEIQESLVHCQPKKSESPRRSFSTPSSKAQQPLTIPGVVQVNLNDEADSTPERTFSQPRPQRTSIKEPLSHRSLLSSSFVSGLNQELLEDAYVPESEKLQHVMGWARKFLKKCDGEEYSQTVTNHKDVSSGDNLAMAKNITKEPKGKSNVDPYKLSRATPSVSFNMVQLTNSLENKKNVHISDNLLSSLESFALSDDFGECNSSDMKKLVNEEETREIFCGEQHFKQNVTVIPTLLSDTKSIDTFTNSNYHWNSCQEDKEADHLLASFPSMERNGIEPNAYKNRCFETKSDCEEKNYHRDRGIVDVKHTNILDSDSENSTVKDSGINTTYFERLKGRASSAVSTIDTERLDTLLLDLGMNHKRSEERSHPSDADGSWTDRTFLVKRFVESETTGRDIIVKSNTGSSHNENPEEQSYISHLLKHLPDDISTISSKLCPVCDFLNNSGASSCTECGSILIDSQTKMNEKQTDVKMQIKQKRDQDERCFTRRPNDFLNYSRSFDETSAANPNAKDKKKPIWEEKSDVNSDGNESVLEKYFFYVNHLEMIKSQEQKSGRKLLPANYSSSDLSSEDSFEDHIGVCSPSRTAELNCRFLSESDSEEDETHFLEGAQVTIKPELVYNSQQAMGKGQTSFSNHLKELGMRKPGPRAEKDLIDSLDRKLPKDIHIASKVTGSKRHWEKSSIAWASYTHGELKTRSPDIRRPDSAEAKKRTSINKNQGDNHAGAGTEHFGSGKYSKFNEMPKWDTQKDSGCMWLLLPDELWIFIFSKLPHKDLSKAAQVCQRFCHIANDASLWKIIEITNCHSLNDNNLVSIGHHHPESLKLNHCHDSGQCITDEGLRKLFQNCKDSLKDLKITNTSGARFEGDAILFHASIYCRKLTSVDISWTAATDKGVIAVIESSPQVQNLSVNGCKITDHTITALVKKHSRSLVKLEVFGCHAVTARCLCTVVTECVYLQCLNIGRLPKVTDVCLAKIASNLNRLTMLNVTGLNVVRDRSVHHIVKQCLKLENLTLSSCSQVTDVSLVEISTYLPTIKYLDVSGCKKVSDIGIQALARSCKQICHLDLSSTGTGKRGVCLLASYCCASLECLKLSFCKDVTADAIEKLCKNCKRLKMLHLYGCRISPDIDSIKKFSKDFKIFHDLSIPAAKILGE
ncbi:uncharacterized protein LOC108705424 isoform X2 [Xenopus laevis]|uniref:Uncharacterized protein LOC108705424 isoform X2 n=1 Tax=Xenopus laevis TaxID=8355 RepID=A0A8J0U667_XENLA|nr:uncharacterized protein LOC108705424 isoform X2 [Xenopus laevis]